MRATGIGLPFKHGCGAPKLLIVGRSRAAPTWYGSVWFGFCAEVFWPPAFHPLAAKGPKPMIDQNQLRRKFATKLKRLFAKSTKHTFEIGDTLLAARESLSHGPWETMCREDLKGDSSLRS